MSVGLGQLSIYAHPFKQICFSARVSDTERVANALGALTRANIVLSDFSLGQPSLDEVFLTLTGKPAEADEVELKGEING